MLLFNFCLASLFFLTVKSVAFFTNSQFDLVEVGKPFNVTWKGNKGRVSLEIVHGEKINLQRTEELVANLVGYSYNWVPSKNLPLEGNVLMIIDLLDREPNYSKKFPIKGGNATWISAEGSDTPTTNPIPTTPNSVPTGLNTPPAEPSSGVLPLGQSGLSTTARTAIYVAVPVVVIIFAACFGLWLRNRRNESRTKIQPIRTMTTDDMGTRNNGSDRSCGLAKLEKSAPNYRSRSHTVSSDFTTSAFKKFFFHEKSLEPTLDQVSTGSPIADPERDASPPCHRALSPNSHNHQILMTPPQQDDQRTTTWDDSPAPPNNRTSANKDIEMDASTKRSYPQYKGPESPTQKHCVVYSAVVEGGYNEAQGSPAPNPESRRWDLSGGTQYQSNAGLVQSSSYELGQNQKFSSPLPQVRCNSSSLRNDETRRQDLYTDVTFGESDNLDVFVRELAAQREKVRAERERVRKLQELQTVEEDLDQQINAAKQKSGWAP